MPNNYNASSCRDRARVSCTLFQHNRYQTCTNTGTDNNNNNNIIIIIIIIIIKYQDLARKVRRMWGVRSKVIPVVVGALGNH